jgi:osmoprotectant transport system permease protein
VVAGEAGQEHVHRLRLADRPADLRPQREGLRAPGDADQAADRLHPPLAALWRVELPLAAPTILAGVRTAAVINVGTATLGGFIGAGGYGRPILRGIDKFDVPLILEGAIPAALLALAIEGLFGLIERAGPHRG